MKEEFGDTLIRKLDGWVNRLLPLEIEKAASEAAELFQGADAG
jgi:hypothetical protein